MFYALDSELSLKLMYEFPQIAVEFDEIDGRIGDFVYRAKVEPFVGEPQRRSILRERRAAHDAEPHLGIVTVGGMTEEISGCRRSSESRDVGCYFFARLPIVEPLARQFHHKIESRLGSPMRMPDDCRSDLGFFHKKLKQREEHALAIGPSNNQAAYRSLDCGIEIGWPRYRNTERATAGQTFEAFHWTCSNARQSACGSRGWPCGLRKTANLQISCLGLAKGSLRMLRRSYGRPEPRLPANVSRM